MQTLKKPCRSYKISYKLKVLEFAYAQSFKEAAVQSRVPLSTVYKWRIQHQEYFKHCPTIPASRCKLEKGLKAEINKMTALNDETASHVLQSTKDISVALAKNRARFPDIEQKLLKAVNACNEHGLPVSPSILRAMMSMLVNNADAATRERALSSKFTASSMWLKGFLKRHSLSNRAFTTSHKVSLQKEVIHVNDNGRAEDVDDALPDFPAPCPTDPNNKAYIPIPEGLYTNVRKDCTDEKALSFFNFVKDMFSKEGLAAESVWNFDEIPMTYDLVQKRTITKKGAKIVYTATTGSTHLRFIVGLTVNARGNKLLHSVWKFLFY